MRSAELTIGRTFGVTFDHGEDFFPTLSTFCRKNRIRHGYIPMFLAAFAEAAIVGACDKLEDPNAPVWSQVHLTNVEAFWLRHPRLRRRARRRRPAHPHHARGKGAFREWPHQPLARSEGPIPRRDARRRGDQPYHDPTNRPTSLQRPPTNLLIRSSGQCGACGSVRSEGVGRGLVKARLVAVVAVLLCCTGRRPGIDARARRSWSAPRLRR